jgi:hypothetical protein
MKHDQSPHVSDGHLSNDQLLDRLYGLGEESASKVPHRECKECSSRFEALERRRSEVVAASSANDAAVPNEFLLAQRRAIYARLDRSSTANARWAPAALAVAFLLVMGVFLARPHPVYRPMLLDNPTSAVDVAAKQGVEPGAERNAEELFSDLYSMEQSVEPQAAAPIHGLFESSASESAQ